ncbi:MAG: hypothetical protein S4CHLAM102_06420 [Chlamydiia bacterium]|nr:hypothetical protein [Chlamydiia bacterium]
MWRKVCLWLGILSGAVSGQCAEWEDTDFIWNFGLVSHCTHGVDKNPRRFFEIEPIFIHDRFRNMERGDIAFIHCCHVHRFQKEILPRLKAPVIVLITGGDETFPNDCDPSFDIDRFLKHEMIGHVFAQNCVIQGEKVTPIPIGIDFHTIAYKGDGGWGEKGTPCYQERVLQQVVANSEPTNERKLGAFIDFQHSDTLRAGFSRYLEFGEDRTDIFNRIKQTGLFEWSGFLPRYQLWRKKAEYAFSISPPGNGLDCHRTWEDLALGCIVIIKEMPINHLYEGLPVIVVSDWGEVTEENLKQWLKKWGNVRDNPAYIERLKRHYWMNKIERVRKEIKEDER